MRDEPVPARHRARTAPTARSPWPTAWPADPGERFDMVLTNPPFGKKSSVSVVTVDGDTKRESPTYRARRLLGLHQQQATQLRPARQDAAEDPRPRRGGRARQRAVRGRRRRDRAPQPAARVRCAHPAAPADRHLLRPGREGQRALLRPQAGPRDSRGRRSCGSTTCAPTCTSRSRQNPLTRGDLDEFVACYHPANRHERDATWSEANPAGPLARVHLRRADGARQGQPGHLLAARREPGGHGQPARAGRDRGRDRRGPARGAGAIRGNWGGTTMDPLTIIATALLAGAAAALKDTAAQAVRDTYTGLKSLIARKFAGAANADDLNAAVRFAEKKPDDTGRQDVLKDELKSARVDQDEEVLKLARALSEAVRQHAPQIAQQYQVSVTGSGAAAGGRVRRPWAPAASWSGGMSVAASTPARRPSPITTARRPLIPPMRQQAASLPRRRVARSTRCSTATST